MGPLLTHSQQKRNSAPNIVKIINESIKEITATKTKIEVTCPADKTVEAIPNCWRIDWTKDIEH
jgi:hypothetical protein